MAIFVWNGGAIRNPYQAFQQGVFTNDAVDYEETPEDVIAILLPYLKQILSLSILINNHARNNAICCKKIEDMDTKIDFLYSAIRDMRRELLRGMVGEVRKVIGDTMKTMLPRGGRDARWNK